MPTPDLVAEICVWKKIMNKRFTTLMTTIILSVFSAISVSAYDVEIDGIYYNLIKKVNTAEVTKGNDKYTGEIKIPETIFVDDVVYSVNKIGNGAFEDCSSLISIIIPNSVTNIGGAAFAGCNKLTSVTIPNSVMSIGNYAFLECSSLSSITLGNSVSSIGEQTFYNCNNLISITIPNSVISIGNGAFNGCSSLTSIVMGNSVKSIGEWTFYNCSSLTSITIPNSVTSIGDYAFEYCHINSITIPNSVTSIGCSAFSWCSNLTSITIPNSVTSIGSSAFYGCSSLTSITIPSSVTSISSSAFEGCSSLTSITIPNSVKSIEWSAFSWCSNLTSITIPNSVTSIGNDAFSNCSSLTSITIPNSMTSIGNRAFSGCSSLTSITIPNSVTSIGEKTFYYCSNLTSITIPNTVTNIKSEAFNGCKNLENIFCYAERVPNTESDVFKDAYIEYATLHIPASATNRYKKISPWSSFGTFNAIEGTETKKCETPMIKYSDGELTFSCGTSNVQFFSEVKNADVKKYYTEKVKLKECYDISVKASKTGYEDSDIATAKLYKLTDNSLDEDNINTSKMRGVLITSADGFITIHGLTTGESVSFYTSDGELLGTAKSTDGSISISAKQGSVVVAKIGNESVDILVK